MDILTELANTLNYWVASLWQFLQTEPLVSKVMDILCVTLPLSFLLAFAGLGFLSGTARVLAVIRKRSSYEKCSHQLALFSVLLGWALLVCTRVWLFHIQSSDVPDSLPNFLLEIGWMLLGMAVMFTSIYYIGWRMCRNVPTLHAVLGIFCGLWALLATAVALAAARLCTVIASPAVAGLTLEQVYAPGIMTPFFCALCMTLPLALGLGGGIGAVWLVLRRKHDDFGRDHYNIMLPWCANWARNAWFFFWLLMLAATSLRIYNQWQGNVFTPEKALLESVILLLWLVPAVLWSIVAHSGAPLRHKLTLWVALALSLAGAFPYYGNMTSISSPTVQEEIISQDDGGSSSAAIPAP